MLICARISPALRSSPTLLVFMPGQIALLPWAFILGKIGLANSVYGLVLVHCIQGLSFTTLFCRNYFVGIPDDLVKAARIDGANRFQLATRIKLPMIWRSLVLMGILSFAAGLQLFVEPQLMQLAGPQSAQNDWSLNQMAFQYAFRMGDFGASAALSTMLVGTSIIIALVIVFATRFYKID